ncbi:MAG: hypothetical protein ABI151_05545, partial [Chitinophagaceae bacterium]
MSAPLWWKWLFLVRKLEIVCHIPAGKPVAVRPTEELERHASVASDIYNCGLLFFTVPYNVHGPGGV